MKINMTLKENLVNRHRDLWIAIFFHLTTLFLIYGFLIGSLDLNRPLPQDVTRYYEYSRMMVEGQRPYTDFSFEYPPLALLPMILPILITAGTHFHYPTYLHVFAIQNCLYSVFVMILLAVCTRRTNPQRAVMPVLFAYMVNMIILSPLLFWRYDIFPAALTVICLYTVLENRTILAGVLVGLGIAAKLYAIVFLPVLLAYYVAKQEWRNLISVFGATASAAGIIFLPFLFMGPTDFFTLFRYHRERGVQLESVVSGLIMMLDAVGFTKSTVAYSHGAWHVVSPMADWLLTIFPIVFVLALGTVALSCYLHFRTGNDLHDAAKAQNMNAYFAMALLSLLIFSNVFSPQFLIWLIPFAVLLPRRQSWIVIGISLMTVGFVTPWIYPHLIERQLPAVLLLNIRNVLVILLFFWLLKSAVSENS